MFPQEAVKAVTKTEHQYHVTRLRDTGYEWDVPPSETEKKNETQFARFGECVLPAFNLKIV